MSKLHEVLAVEGSLGSVASKLTTESIKTFGKSNLFTGFVKTHQMFNEEQQHLVQADEVSNVTTTVQENLQYLFSEGLVPYWDAVAQKDDANQRARADIIVNGETILKDVPGTTLLGLEAKLGNLLELFNKIPSLPPGRTWEQDVNQKAGILVDPIREERQQNVKEPDFKVLYEATKEHKAQIKEFEKNVTIGKFTITHYSGMVSPIQKAEMIKRLQSLISAVKKARQRANGVEVNDVHIGQQIQDFLLGK